MRPKIATTTAIVMLRSVRANTRKAEKATVVRFSYRHQSEGSDLPAATTNGPRSTAIVNTITVVL